MASCATPARSSQIGDRSTSWDQASNPVPLLAAQQLRSVSISAQMPSQNTVSPRA
jgi:hypothetical protein